MKYTADNSRSSPALAILKYTALTYGITWISWLPGILASRGVIGEIPWPPLFALGATGPLFAAIWCLQKERGWNGVGEWFRGGFSAPIQTQWWLAILLLPFLSPLLVLAIHTCTGGNVLRPEVLDKPWLALPALLMMLTIGGAQEEYGWRGFLLPRLDRVFESWQSDALLILLHTLWHFPLFLIAYTVQHQYPFWLFFAFGAGFTPLVNMVFRRTGGSILAALLFHGLVNTGLELFPLVGPAVGSSSVPLLLLSLLLASLAAALKILSPQEPKSLLEEQ